MYQNIIKNIVKVAILPLAIGSIFWGLPIQSSIKAGDITGGAKAPHLNIAAFHKLHGQESFNYPKEIDKKGILSTLDGKAQFIFMNHTSGLKDGDVITVSSDVLRDNAGSFDDFGVDCQLSVHLKNKALSLAGICEFLMVDQDNREIQHKGIIKPIPLTTAGSWTLIYYDEEDGIAIYADNEFGLE